ncbi:hypothetical protein SSX86_031499 [Deinandra increscens subsp. villosa]|uniref:Uncharacterized protein n=1 Tax=Deinandra increscens subsp. villosa TaxID=3103831 RepID=A0AAP0C8U1_9ASTR
MDTKSLAKSKRAHSLHHKKHPPNQKVKGATTSVAPSGTDKALGKAVKEKTRACPIALASNWDRYEDKDDLMLDNQIDGQASQQGDAVVPKSTGADYAYLISEAKAQNSTKLSSEIFPSLDDFVSDFGLGKESFFAVRGESLLSSIQNDSFFVDDEAPANYEASFLSLNMHALAEQLVKIYLPKRLFMEADLFLPEQVGMRNLKQHFEQVQERKAPTTTTTTPNSNPKSVANQSKLKAEAAETELDILLDSFDHVNLKEKASSTKKNTLDFDIDGELDDLLKETSSTPSLLDASQTQHMSKSGPLDDFDSWLDTI